ncbi:hypothetical protein K2O51_15920 [Cupriavidus pinatubonensis]|uniref:hypothetical protein n=1 Tax=Cupriavidus pinatubonensis TaxID=248026 RepID=UPI001125EC26|nr:hypothetical protein [Cupriavidus pinatubonensis]QYY32277.1 hypothetical protein K2O51_15920 [Cupriavidus pinatubonensis]TPQ34374.1 hypothetical protein C2U69_22715 [Cupriavidus pinatubonensis]
MKRILMLIALAAGTAGLAGTQAALAKLPSPTDAQKAKAEETKARTAWADKVAAFQLCKAQDKVAARYYGDMKTSGKGTHEPVQTAACADPGPFVPPAAPATPAAAAAVQSTAKAP